MKNTSIHQRQFEDTVVTQFFSYENNGKHIHLNMDRVKVAETSMHSALKIHLFVLWSILRPDNSRKRVKRHSIGSLTTFITSAIRVRHYEWQLDAETWKNKQKQQQQQKCGFKDHWSHQAWCWHEPRAPLTSSRYDLPSFLKKRE